MCPFTPEKNTFQSHPYPTLSIRWSLENGMRPGENLKRIPSYAFKASNSTTELLNRNQSYLCINQVLFSFRPIIVEPNSKAKETERNVLQTYKDVPSPCFSWTKFKVNQICYSSKFTLTSSLFFFTSFLSIFFYSQQ
jgi:hypothetical protein